MQNSHYAKRTEHFNYVHIIHQKKKITPEIAAKRALTENN
jgi:hypothetical protein